MTQPVKDQPMQAAFLPIISGLIATTWIYITVIIVVVFGAGGWESWSHG